MTTNPALADLQFLAGIWDMELSEASFLPDPEATVHGAVTFEWIEQGAALVMRMGDAATPTATWIFGRDEAEPGYRVLYADDRGVSRIYQMSFSNGTWRMWRDTPEFSQRFDAEVSASQTEVTGSWLRSADGGTTWEHDFTVRYSRPLPVKMGHDDCRVHERASGACRVLASGGPVRRGRRGTGRDPAARTGLGGCQVRQRRRCVHRRVPAPAGAAVGRAHE
jgi:hypothetical protein